MKTNMCTKKLIHLRIFLLGAFLVCSALMLFSFSSKMNDSNNIHMGETTLKNALYASAITNTNSVSDIKAEETPASNQIEFTCKDSVELYTKVRESMISRITDFSIIYTGDSPENVLTLKTFSDFLKVVYAYDDPSNSSDFDYLKLSWTKVQLSAACRQKVPHATHGALF